MEKKRTRKGLACLLALCLCLTLLPAAAWAVGGDTGGNDTAGGGNAGDVEMKDVTSWGALQEAMEYNNTISINLLADVKCQGAITIGDGKNLTIYLNGNKLTGADSSSVITVEDGGTLTIQNANAGDPGMPGKITGGSGENGGGIYVAGGDVKILGNAEISDNTASGSGLGGGVYNTGTFTMEGGAIHSNIAGQAAADFLNGGGGRFTLRQTAGYTWYEDEPHNLGILRRTKTLIPRRESPRIWYT